METTTTTQPTHTTIAICGECGHAGPNEAYIQPSRAHVSGYVMICPQCKAQLHKSKVIVVSGKVKRDTIGVGGYFQTLRTLVDALAEQYPYIERQQVEEAVCRYLARQLEQALGQSAEALALDPAFRQQLAVVTGAAQAVA